MSHAYSGYRRRGGGGSWRGSTHKWQRTTLPATIPQSEPVPLGPLLKTITLENLESTSIVGSSTANIAGCQYAGSYSWAEGACATVLVPGKPPTWTPPKQSIQLRPDDGTYFRDPNAARYPSHPMEPAVRAVLAQNPNLSTDDIDVFACGSTLGNLLRFARKIPKSFRFNVKVIGGTMFFIRKENSPTELIPDVRGFGHTFPEAYTTWDSDVKDSVSHQRIIEYDFGGQRLMVRFQSDGYRKDFDTGNISDMSKVAEAPKTLATDDPSKLLESLNIETVSGSTSATTASSSLLQMRTGGRVIPQEAVFDLKTKHSKYPIDMSEIYPRLWVSRVPNLLVAYHSKGVFSNLRWLDVREDVRKWEEENVNALRRLAVLIREIKESVCNVNDGKIEVVCDGGDNLEIREQHGKGKDVLPTDLVETWVIRSVPRDEKAVLEYSHRDGKDQWRASDSDDGTEPDYTACSAEDCGYCGRCTY